MRFEQHGLYFNLPIQTKTAPSSHLLVYMVHFILFQLAQAKITGVNEHREHGIMRATKKSHGIN